MNAERFQLYSKHKVLTEQPTHHVWWRQTFLPCAVLAALTVALHWRATECDFVNWDDDWLVTDNPAIRDMSWSGLAAMFNPWCDPVRRAQLGGEYLPLRDLSYAVELSLFGENAFWFHLDNLLIHAASAVLLFLIARFVVRSTGFACAASLLFALHPVHVESVVWVTGRKDVLCVFFMLASLYLSARSRYTLKGRRRRLFGVLSVLCFVAALMSKSYAVAFPPLLMAFDLAFGASSEGGRKMLRRAYHWVWYWAVNLFFVVVIMQIAGRGLLRDWYGDPPSWWTTAGMMGKVWADYAALLVYPVTLQASVDYPWRDPLTLKTLAGWTLVIAAALAALWCVRATIRDPRPGYRLRDVAAFGAAWILISLVPVSQLVTPHGTVYAERFLYLPSVGFALAAAALLLGASRWRRARSGDLIPGAPGARRAFRLGWGGALGLILMAAVYGERLRRHIPVWTNSRTLWLDVEAKDPGHFTAHFNLAHEAVQRALSADSGSRARAMAEAFHRFERALGERHETLRYNPTRAALMLATLEREYHADFDAARERLRLADRLFDREDWGEPPRLRDQLHAALWNEWGNWHFDERNPARDVKLAARLFGDAHALDARSPFLLVNLATVEAHQGRILDAKTHLRQALEIAPDFDDAYLQLGRINFRGGQFGAAETSFRFVLERSRTPRQLLVQRGAIRDATEGLLAVCTRLWEEGRLSENAYFARSIAALDALLAPSRWPDDLEWNRARADLDMERALSCRAMPEALESWHAAIRRLKRLVALIAAQDRAALPAFERERLTKLRADVTLLVVERARALGRAWTSVHAAPLAERLRAEDGAPRFAAAAEVPLRLVIGALHRDLPEREVGIGPPHGLARFLETLALSARELAPDDAAPSQDLGELRAAQAAALLERLEALPAREYRARRALIERARSWLDEALRDDQAPDDTKRLAVALYHLEARALHELGRGDEAMAKVEHAYVFFPEPLGKTKLLAYYQAAREALKGQAASPEALRALYERMLALVDDVTPRIPREDVNAVVDALVQDDRQRGRYEDGVRHLRVKVRAFEGDAQNHAAAWNELANQAREWAAVVEKSARDADDDAARDAAVTRARGLYHQAWDGARTVIALEIEPFSRSARELSAFLGEKLAALEPQRNRAYLDEAIAVLEPLQSSGGHIAENLANLAWKAALLSSPVEDDDAQERVLRYGALWRRLAPAENDEHRLWMDRVEVRALRARARRELRDGNPPGARVAAEAALRLAADDIEARTLLALALEQQEFPDEALAALSGGYSALGESAARWSAAERELAFHRGRLAEDLGQGYEAYSAFRRYLQACESEDLAPTPEQALAREIIERVPRRFQESRRLGQECFQRFQDRAPSTAGDADLIDAERHFESALRDARPDARAFVALDLARVRIERGRFRAARESLDLARREPALGAPTTFFQGEVAFAQAQATKSAPEPFLAEARARFLELLGDRAFQSPEDAPWRQRAEQRLRQIEGIN